MTKDIFQEALDKMKVFSETGEKFGFAEDRWVTRGKVALTQEPYLVDGPDAPEFKAEAIDKAGKEYEVTWFVVDNWEEVAEQGDDQALVKEWEYFDELEII